MLVVFIIKKKIQYKKQIKLLANFCQKGQFSINKIKFES